METGGAPIQAPLFGAEDVAYLYQAERRKVQAKAAPAISRILHILHIGPSTLRMPRLKPVIATEHKRL
jgi:hypothetical protein